MPHPKQKQREGVKVLKARVMFCCEADLRETKGTSQQPFECVEESSNYGHRLPVLLLPFPTLRSAKAAKRFWGLSEDQKLDAIATALMNHDSSPVRYWSTCRNFCAPAILNLIQGTTK